uniref:Uncharacterized protein n=1 Tax=Strigamia maritima TaxID=126957 RepID=T1JLS8_STRMM
MDQSISSEIEPKTLILKHVFMISAKNENDDEVKELQEYILERTKSSPWFFSSSLVTGQSPSEIVLMAVREKLLDNLPRSIPYVLIDI